MLFLFLVLIACFIYLWHKGHYTYRLGQRLGIKIGTPPPDQEVIALSSWKSSIAQLNISTDVVMFGDSLTRWGNFQKFFPDVRIINLGYSGDTLKGMIERVDMVKSVRAQKIFAQGGINGFINNGIIGTFEDYKELLALLQKENKHSKIFVQSMLPVGFDKSISKKIAKFNIKLFELCEELGIVYIDLFSIYSDESGNLPSEISNDGIHIKDYQKWFEAIKCYIQEEL